MLGASIIFAYVSYFLLHIIRKRYYIKKSIDQTIRSRTTFTALQKIKLSLIFPEHFQTTILDENVMPMVELKKKKRLTSLHYNRTVFHLEFRCDKSYEPGDAIGLYPENESYRVNNLLEILNIKPTQVINYTKGSNRIFTNTYRFLRYYADLNKKINKKFLKFLSTKCTSKYYRLKLAHLSSDDTDGFKVLVANAETPYSILSTYGKYLDIRAKDFPEMFSEMCLRYYSISSSLTQHPGEIHVLVLLDKWQTPNDLWCEGLTSSFLCSMKIGKKLRYKIKKYELELPKQTNKKLVMLGLGTGIAPYRSFLEANTSKECMLFFGARTKKEEFYYKDDLAHFQKNGQLKLFTAFSRDQRKKIYIQNLLENQKIQIRSALENGYLYLCGGKSSCKAIENKLEELGVDLISLRKQGRYLREVY